MEAALIPFVILAALGGVVMFLMAVLRLKHGALVIGAMLGASALAGNYDPIYQPVRTWLLPIQQQRSYIFAALGAVTFLLTLIHVGKLRFERVPSTILLLAAAAMYAGVVRMISGKPQDGMISIVFAAATILPLALLIPAIASEDGGYFRMMRIIGLVAAAWTFGVAVQFVINRSALSRGGLGSLRFQGLLANPQHAMAYLAPSFVVILCLYLHDPLKRFKLFWMCLLGMVGVMVLWTGSRTGVAISVVGSAFVLYSRVGRSILLAPIALGVVFAAYQVLSMLGVDLFLERLVSTHDTRSAAWSGLWHQFLESPMFGSGGTEEAIYSENGFLLALASYGVLMAPLLGGVVLLSVFQCFRLLRARSAFSARGKSVVDLTIAVHVMYFAGAMTEGYLVSRVSTMLVCICIFSAFASCLIDDARRAAHSQLHEFELSEDDADPDPAQDSHPYAEYGEAPGHEDRAAG